MESFMRESDAFSWYLESDPVLRSIVVSAMWFETPPDWDRFVARVDRAVRMQPSFLQRIVEAPGRLTPPRWTVDPEFDLDWHVARMAAPPGEGDRFVVEVSRREAMTGFDPVHPLWRFLMIEGLEGGRAALVMKMHHSLMDGVGAMELAFNLFDHRPVPDQLPACPQAPAGERVGAARMLREHLVRRAGQTARTAEWAATGSVPALLSVGRRPLSSARSALAMARSVGRTVAPLTDTMSTVMRDRGTGRSLDYIDLTLADLQAAARAAGGTLNDAFVAAAAGGLRLYHEHHGAPVQQLRLMMPINLRTARDPAGGNRITLMRYAVPVGEKDPFRRIASIDRSSRAVRHEPSLPYTNVIAGGLNLLPPVVVGSIFKHVDFIASDVPGFPESVYLAGAKVSRHVAFGPTTGTALNLTLLSYCGRCSIGVNMDTSAVPDPDRLVECLRAGFDEVLQLARPPRAAVTSRPGRTPGRSAPSRRTATPLTQTNSTPLLRTTRRSVPAGKSRTRSARPDPTV